MRAFARLPFVVLAAVVVSWIAVPNAAGAATAPIFVTFGRGGVAQFDPATGKKTGFLYRQNADGLTVDGAGNLYVGITNSNPASFAIEEFAPGAVKPMRVIVPNQEFANIAADPATGELAVAGSEGGDCCSNALLFFEPGQTQPSRVIAKYGAYGSVAYDGAGNCWVVAFPYHGPTVFGYVPPGGKSIVPVPLEGSPGDGPIGIDASGHLVVFRAGALLVYTTAGKLMGTVRLQARPASLSGFVFSADGSIVYTASVSTTLAAYRYPAGGAPIRAFGWYATSIARGIGQ